MNPVTGLSLGRIAIGVVAFARPEVLVSSLGADPATQPSSSFVTRMFASREVALGTATLLSRGKARSGLVLLGVGGDGADAAAGYLGLQDKQLPQRAGVTMTAVAVGAVLAGLAGLRPRRATKVAA